MWREAVYNEHNRREIGKLFLSNDFPFKGDAREGIIFRRRRLPPQFHNIVDG